MPKANERIRRQSEQEREAGLPKNNITNKQKTLIKQLVNFREELDKAVKDHKYLRADMNHPLVALAVMSTNRVFDDIRKIDISYDFNDGNKIRFDFIPSAGGKVQIVFEDGMFLSNETVRYLQADKRLRISNKETLPPI